MLPEINNFDKNTDQSGLFFNSLTKSLCDSTREGIISFDCELRIIDYTPPSIHYFTMKSRIDILLSEAADVHGWKNWTEIIRSVVTLGQTVRFDAVKVKRQDCTYLLDMIIAAVYDPENKTIVGGGLIVNDVTNKMALLSETAQTERLATMGKVAGRVAHELNNPLDGILRYVNLALRGLETQPDKAKQYLQQCRDGLMRMVRIVGEMLEFSRGIPAPFEKEALDKVADDALAAMAGVLEGIEVRFVREYEGSALPVKSEALFQVFCNLIKNAADAMGGTGVLTVCLARTADGWQAAFRDTGGGFDPSLAEDLFKPFFTTKPAGRGTGLGLAICRDILNKLGGQIRARNIDRGSEFVVMLPEK